MDGIYRDLHEIGRITREISDFMTEQQGLNREMIREKTAMKEIEADAGELVTGHSENVAAIASDLNDITTMGRDNTAALEEIVASSREMASGAGELYARMEKFKV